jgi:fatty acid desaturase
MEEICSSGFSALNDPALKQRLQQLRQADNRANWYYIARTWLGIVLVAGAAVTFATHWQSWGLAWWWNAPVFAAAIALVGAWQHHLSGLGHEASHHILFRNRRLNDLASDWLCMFPLFTSTYQYRLQHLAHHQFVNDPERDPDVSQLRASGHWTHFPLSRRQAWRMLLGQLWIPNLIRFMRVRALYNVVGAGRSPYLRADMPRVRWPGIITTVYLIAQVALVRVLMSAGNSWGMALGSLLLWGATVLAFLKMPQRWFPASRIHPTIGLRTTAIMRLTFLTLLVNALGWTTWLTGHWAALYFLLLWVVPLWTSYAFFMVLRQSVQHGNGGRGMLTNTRVFFMNRLVNFCVFPIGQHYHLPHHLFATVPHFRLPQLHEALLAYPDYRQQALEVENYFVPSPQPPHRPTVVDVLGPEYAPRPQGIYIDNSVLDDHEVDEAAEIRKATLTSAQSA